MSKETKFARAADERLEKRVETYTKLTTAPAESRKSAAEARRGGDDHAPARS